MDRGNSTRDADSMCASGRLERLFVFVLVVCSMWGEHMLSMWGREGGCLGVVSLCFILWWFRMRFWSNTWKKFHLCLLILTRSRSSYFSIVFIHLHWEVSIKTCHELLFFWFVNVFASMCVCVCVNNIGLLNLYFFSFRSWIWTHSYFFKLI